MQWTSLPRGGSRWLMMALGCLLLTLPAALRAEGPTRFVLVAGPLDGHPHEVHEYFRDVAMLRHLLERATNLSSAVEVATYFGDWPTDPAILEQADAVVIVSAGSQPGRPENHPLYVGNRREQLQKAVAAGCGVAFLHYATFTPRSDEPWVLATVGGYFDYESGDGPRNWFSRIETREFTVRLEPGGHPILRGVEPFTTPEEFYLTLRLAPESAGLEPLVRAGRPAATAGTDDIVGWAIERSASEGGGRGFGFTGGHFLENWWDDDYRRFLLNAVTWTAGMTVPEGGVATELEGPIDVAILTGDNGAGHDWVSTTVALVLGLEQDPRVSVRVWQGLDHLEPERLAQVDAVVLNYCNWASPGPTEPQKLAFLDYVRGGGGVAVVHFSNGAFHHSLPRNPENGDWPEYRQIVRRVWDHSTQGPERSAHDPYGSFLVETTDVSHPITAGLADFETRDELYYNQAGEARIVPLVVARSKRTGKDEPLAWAFQLQGGRVFQTLLGHDAESVRKAAALIRRGTVWAAGAKPLTFDPPVELLEGAGLRRGYPWSPPTPQE